MYAVSVKMCLVYVILDALFEKGVFTSVREFELISSNITLIGNSKARELIEK